MTSTSSYDFNNLQDLTRSYKSFGADRPAPEKSENPSTCPGALLPRQLLLLLKFHGGLAWSGCQAPKGQQFLRVPPSRKFLQMLRMSVMNGHDAIPLQCLWTRSSGWRRMRSAGRTLSRPHLRVSLAGQIEVFGKSRENPEKP